VSFSDWVSSKGDTIVIGKKVGRLCCCCCWAMVRTRALVVKAVHSLSKPQAALKTRREHGNLMVKLIDCDDETIWCKSNKQAVFL